MRPPLSTSEFMLYNALCQDSPATLNELIERLQNEPYQWEVTLAHLAAVAGRLEAKGYVSSEKVASGRRGQPPAEYRPLVPLEAVIRAQTERALADLTWGDRESLLVVRKVVDEALKAQTPRPPAEARKGQPRQDARTLRHRG